MEVIMFCPVCNTLIEDENVRYCPNCNENIKIAEQRAKVNEGIAKNGEILKGIFRSKRFLTYCIILSIACGLYALAFLESLPTLNIGAGLYAGLGIASLVAAWQIYASAVSKKPEKKLISQMKLFPTLMHIMSTIVFVLMIIVSVAMVFGFVAILGAMSEVDSLSGAIKEAIAELEAQGMIVFEEDFTPETFYGILDVVERYLVPVFIAIIVLLAGITVFYYFEKKAYKSEKLFLENLEATVITSVYMTPFNFSSKLLKVIGIFEIIISAPSAILMGIGGIAPVMLGVHMIITSLLFKDIDGQLSENSKYVSQERSILDNMMYEERMYQQSQEQSQAAEQ